MSDYDHDLLPQAVPASHRVLATNRHFPTLALAKITWRRAIDSFVIGIKLARR